MRLFPTEFEGEICLPISKRKLDFKDFGFVSLSVKNSVFPKRKESIRRISVIDQMYFLHSSRILQLTTNKILSKIVFYFSIILRKKSLSRAIIHFEISNISFSIKNIKYAFWSSKRISFGIYQRNTAGSFDHRSSKLLI